MKGVHRHSTGTRDAALRRLTSANRWLIAGSVALTGVLSEVAAQAFPGKKLGSASAASKHAPSTRSRSAAPPAEEFHPPEQAPQAAPESEGSQGSGSSESSPQAGESSPQASESAPPSSESSPPAESPAQPAGEASAEAPVVSGGS